MTSHKKIHNYLAAVTFTLGALLVGFSFLSINESLVKEWQLAQTSQQTTSEPLSSTEDSSEITDDESVREQVCANPPEGNEEAVGLCCDEELLPSEETTQEEFERIEQENEEAARQYLEAADRARVTCGSLFDAIEEGESETQVSEIAQQAVTDVEQYQTIVSTVGSGVPMQSSNTWSVTPDGMAQSAGGTQIAAPEGTVSAVESGDGFLDFFDEDGNNLGAVQLEDLPEFQGQTGQGGSGTAAENDDSWQQFLPEVDTTPPPSYEEIMADLEPVDESLIDPGGPLRPENRRTPGVCNPDILGQYFPADTIDGIACVMQNESSCGLNLVARPCDNRPFKCDVLEDENRTPFSFGQLQINLTVHELRGCGPNGEDLDCKSAFSKGIYGQGGREGVVVTDRDLYLQCAYAAQDIDCNLRNSNRIRQERGWTPWLMAMETCKLNR